MVTTKSKLVSKKVMIPVILGIGITLSVIFIASSLGNSWGQQQSVTNYTNIREYDKMPKTNGSISEEDNIKNLLIENTKVSFESATETAQKQISNGTVLGGHLGIKQGFLTYTFHVVDQTKDVIHKVIIDAGNGQVLYTSDGIQIDSFNPSKFGPFGKSKGHEFGGAPWYGFGGFWHGPFMH
ncbi:MAG: PepSY domain-containing protein [Nitrosopumilus sp.]|nr:PepSY domain-containing protein [Nitrosopumilus sp.]